MAMKIMNLLVVNKSFQVVDSPVAPIPSQIFIDIFCRLHRENYQEWDHCNVPIEGLYHRHEVQDDDEKEIKVGDSVKLLEQIFGEEGQKCVFCGSNFVAGECFSPSLPGSENTRE